MNITEMSIQIISHKEYSKPKNLAVIMALNEAVESLMNGAGALLF